MMGPPADRGVNARALGDLFTRSAARRGEVRHRRDLANLCYPVVLPRDKPRREEEEQWPLAVGIRGHSVRKHLVITPPLESWS